MHSFHLHRIAVLVFPAVLLGLYADARGAGPPAQPNIVVFFADDLGYGDLSSFGSTKIATPNLDQMATQGVKLTSFYVSPVCTPSRAQLMTGAYAKRVGGHTSGVLRPNNRQGLNPVETTLPEVLKRNGYATGMVGKWHLGRHDDQLPNAQGFDEYFGIPYSNDMSAFEQRRMNPNSTYPYKLPLIRNNEVIDTEPAQVNLTHRLTQEAVSFIERKKNEPFFLYVAHPQPHIPVYASPDFQGTSNGGAYGDSVQELDWSMGQILQALKDNGVDDNTLVIFLSDNGPALGSAGALRGKKGSTWEGGVRVPAIMRWQGAITPGAVNDEVLTGMDVLPTIAGIIGDPLEDHLKIDGRDLSQLVTSGFNSDVEDKPYFYVNAGAGLDGVRLGNWKLRDGALYNLATDIGEQNNVAAANPAVFAQLAQLMNDFSSELNQNIRPMVNGTLPSAPDDPSLMTHYNFNNNVTDHSNNPFARSISLQNKYLTRFDANHANTDKDARPAYAPGVIDQAMQFDGVDDYAYADDDGGANVGTSDFTLMMWVKRDRDNTQEGLFDKLAGGSDAGYQLAIAADNHVAFTAKADNAAAMVVKSSGMIDAASDWTHLAVVVDRSGPDGLKFYLDGVLDSTHNASSLHNRDLNSQIDLFLGALASSNTNVGRFFDGSLDELFIYHRALSGMEINQASQVPEPASAMLMMGAGGLLALKRR